MTESSILFIFFFFIAPIIILPIVFLLKENRRTPFDNTTAKPQQPGIPHRPNTIPNGREGEWMVFDRIKRYGAMGCMFLSNLYIPTQNNETTEIDLLMISPKGLIVFESKDYGGWIFGNEESSSWYQTLPIHRGQSRKERFYNPIKQNATHIFHLKKMLNLYVPTWSVIVFSDRATLKDTPHCLPNHNTYIINLSDVLETVAAIYKNMPNDYLTAEEIQNIYRTLLPTTLVDEETKRRHIDNIQKRWGTHTDEPQEQIQYHSQENYSTHQSHTYPRTDRTMQPEHTVKGVFVGAEVVHRIFGSGKIITQTGNRITVEFKTNVAVFEYPNAFDQGFLSVAKPGEEGNTFSPASKDADQNLWKNDVFFEEKQPIHTEPSFPSAPLPEAAIGETVHHMKFGEGTVIEKTDRLVTVRFAERDVAFQYPQAFLQKFLTK